MKTHTRPRSRRGEGDALRGEILDAAERLIVRAGDAGAVSVRAIAAAVGVSPPAIYLHFPDKDALVFAVCERRFEEFDATLEAAGATTDDPVESLRRRGRAYVEFGVEHPEAYRVLFMTTNGAASPPDSAGRARSSTSSTPSSGRSTPVHFAPSIRWWRRWGSGPRCTAWWHC